MRAVERMKHGLGAYHNKISTMGWTDSVEAIGIRLRRNGASKVRPLDFLACGCFYYFRHSQTTSSSLHKPFRSYNCSVSCGGEQWTSRYVTD